MTTKDSDTVTTPVGSSNDSIISVGQPSSPNLSIQLLDQINDLKSASNKVTSDLCTLMTKTSIASITPDDIKNCGKLHKKLLGEQLLSLLPLCAAVCHSNNLDYVASPPNEI